MNDAGFLPILQEAAFSKEEENVLKARLFALLSVQVRLRTQGDHSSLREEDAAELLESLMFTLRYQLFLRGLPLRVLLTADLRETLREGQAALQVCVNAAETLYHMALRQTVTFGSRSLKDTLSGIGQFFRGYDLLLYAHRIPAAIDYQLCAPVEDGLRGALYIRAYLDRLLAENALLTRFPQGSVEALLRRASPDYRELLPNLYEPVAACAVGLALLGGDVSVLEVTGAQAADIHARFASLPPEAALDWLSQAAETVCQTLRLTGDTPRGYLRQAAQSLAPRLALSPQSACGVFSAATVTTH